MIDIREIIKKPEYKWIEEYKDRLCFLVISGSNAYGTNLPTSDIDIRGVVLPTKEELIGLKTFEQRLDEKTDTTLYEFNRFIKLLMQMNPNIVELLGCKEYLVFNEIGDLLLNKVNLFLSKNCIKTFAGYATAQLRRLENGALDGKYTEDEKRKYIKQSMEITISKLEEKNKLFKEGSIKIDNEDNKLLVSLNINKEPLGLVRSCLNDLLNIESTYNKLNCVNDRKDQAHLQKHMMHLIRLYLTVFDLLEKGQIVTYRGEERDFLLSVRNGLFYNEDGKVKEDFYTYLNQLEERLNKDKELDILPDKPNYKEIEELVVEVNKKIIDETVLKYKEPLYEVIV